MIFLLTTLSPRLLIQIGILTIHLGRCISIAFLISLPLTLGPLLSAVGCPSSKRVQRLGSTTPYSWEVRRGRLIQLTEHKNMIVLSRRANMPQGDDRGAHSWVVP